MLYFPSQSYCPISLCKWSPYTFTGIQMDLTFLIQSTNYVVNIIREEASRVQDCRKHGCNCSWTHDLIIGMLVHLEHIYNRGKQNVLAEIVPNMNFQASRYLLKKHIKIKQDSFALAKKNKSEFVNEKIN